MAPRPVKRDYSVREFFESARPGSPERPMNSPSTPRTPHTVLLEIDSGASSRSDYHTAKGADGHTQVRRPPRDNIPEPVVESFPIETLDTDEPPALTVDTGKKSTLAGFINSGSMVTRDAPSDTSSTRLPDFFSQSTFQTALTSPTIAYQLQQFADARLAGESMLFLTRLNQYNGLLDEVTKSIASLHKDFISSTADRQVNIDNASHVKTNLETKSALAKSLPQLETVFAAARTDVERLMYMDVYPNFVKYQMSVSAARALGGDRSKYAGLGDCFVLTDPNKADNPIVFASDGFVDVTGYLRNEIIPRNCRFLQGRHSSQASVRRLKSAIHNREESVELLVNEKRDGQPFMNLLYTTPLFTHGRSEPVFFLGGQINCSTTIHNTSDVLRILAQSKDVDNPAAQNSPTGTLKQRKSASILSAFRSSKAVQPKLPGMETTLLEQMEGMSSQNQLASFHTAYSHYIIVNYSTFLISFISARFTELLFPIKSKSSHGAQSIGIDIFKFLANHGSGNISWDFKSSVKAALKAGQPISVDIKLCAKPYMSFEQFVSHWTPLKDEYGVVHWVVLTLGNERRIGMAY